MASHIVLSRQCGAQRHADCQGPRLHFAKLLPYEFVVVPKKHVDANTLQFVHVEKDLLAFLEKFNAKKNGNEQASANFIL